MIGRILDASSRHRGVVLVATALAALAAFLAAGRLSIDATPDHADRQVIVLAEWPGRSANLVEDRIARPLSAGLMGLPSVAEVRGASMTGMALLYLVLEDGADVGDARARVATQLAALRAALPEEASAAVGPDASAVGWVYQYALTDRAGRLDRLRAFQDGTLRPALAALPGVAEVAAVGGHMRQVEVTVDPSRLAARGLRLSEVMDAVRAANLDGGGQTLELAGSEVVVRARGAVTSAADLEVAVVRGGPPAVLLRDVATVSLGPAPRRGLADWNGEGEAVGGIVVMRQGENALAVIDAVKARLAELGPLFPDGVELQVAYDRSSLIRRALSTLTTALLEEGLAVTLCILLFLLHVRSALLPALSLPLVVLLSALPMALFDVPATIMSLGGLAIALGAAIDAEIVMIEACHRRLESAGPGTDRRALLAAAARQVTPAIFFSLLVVAVAFVPVFALTGQAAHLFRPLAFTKTSVMVIAALLSITFAPALRDLLVRGRIRPEADHPVSRFCRRVYQPVVLAGLRNPRSTLLIGLFAVISAVPVAMRLGHEFMPPLDEGDLLYMPTTSARITVEEAKQALQRQDRVLRSFPEVASVLGKVGRASSATDPAPITMIETTVRLRPRSDGARGSRAPATWSAPWTRACSFPAGPTRGPCRSRPGSTCRPPASAPRSGSRSSGPTRPRSTGPAAPSSRSWPGCRARAGPPSSGAPAASTPTSRPTAPRSPAPACASPTSSSSSTGRWADARSAPRRTARPGSRSACASRPTCSATSVPCARCRCRSPRPTPGQPPRRTQPPPRPRATA